MQLLERGSISGDVEGNTKLLEIVPPPVMQYLPEDARKIGKKKKPEKDGAHISSLIFIFFFHVALSWNAPKVRLYDFFKESKEGQPVVVAVGAMAKGPDTFADEYVKEKIGKSLLFHMWRYGYSNQS